MGVFNLVSMAVPIWIPTGMLFLLSWSPVVNALSSMLIIKPFRQIILGRCMRSAVARETEVQETGVTG